MQTSFDNVLRLTMAVIEVNHVTKEFRLGQFHSLKQSVLEAVTRLRGQPVQLAAVRHDLARHGSLDGPATR